MSEEYRENPLEQEEEIPTIVLTDENGMEKEYTILASFESDEGRNYVIYYDEEEEGEDDFSIYAARVETTDGVETLLPIETEEEWAMVDEVLARMDEESDVWEDEE